MDVCFRGKSGRAADITGTATLRALKFRTAAVSCAILSVLESHVPSSGIGDDDEAESLLSALTTNVRAPVN
jgi:hypothetical protein